MPLFCRALLAALSMAAFAAPLAAMSQAEPKIHVKPDRDSMYVGETLRLRVVVEGEGVEYVGPPKLPDLSPQLRVLRMEGPSTQQSVNMINGNVTRTSRVSVLFLLKAESPGTVTIPPLSYQAGNRVARSDPAEVTIMDVPETKIEDGPTGWSPPYDPFIETRITKKELYVGEQAVVAWHIYYQENMSDLRLVKAPTSGDFLVADLGMADQLNATPKMFPNGRWMTAFMKSMALYPIKAGELTIDGFGLNYLKPGRGRDFFGNPMMTREYVESREETVTVKPLPEAGKPADFSGAVGDFEILLDRREGRIEANGQFKFTVTIRGTGHPDFIKKPDADLPGSMDIYTEDADKAAGVENGVGIGSRSFKMILVPHEAGDFEVGPFTMDYFDPEAGQYRVAESAKILLHVEPGDDSGPSAAVPSEPGLVTAMNKDLRFIKPDRDGLGRGAAWLIEGPLVLAAQLLPPVAIAVAFGLRRRRDRLEKDVAYARKLRAGKKTRRLLAEARKAMGTGDYPGALARAQQSLFNHVADRLNLPARGLTTPEAVKALEDAGASGELVAEFKALSDKCDMARFAPGALTPGGASELVGKAADVHERIARELSS